MTVIYSIVVQASYRLNHYIDCVFINNIKSEYFKTKQRNNENQHHINNFTMHSFFIYPYLKTQKAFLFIFR